MSSAETEVNPNGLRVVRRTIVSAYILSEDDLLLMGRQDPERGGTWPKAWRIPGGGKEPGETREEAMVREGREEVIGLDLRKHELTELPLKAHGAHEKTLENGERVWQEMDFHHFMARLGGIASSFEFLPGGDLKELQWFNRQDRSGAEQIPVGRDMMLQAGLIDS
ncbi:MAG TPA: NUDIX hydrolase [Candidatus Saccharimonadales bacterium]|nr:NUDIX hydrolase [Candidatus Saccharimonadales bacterium]